MSYDNLIEQTFPEHWPNDVQALAVPHEAMFVEKDDLIAMASGFPKLREEFDLRKVQNFSDLLTDWAQAEIKSHKNGAFVKTSYGMFKQNPFAYVPVWSWKDFLSNVRWPDRRIEGFLRNRLSLKSPMHIVISEWRDIPAWAEFRLFILDRKIVGVSQYHHQTAYPEIQENLEAINASLIPFSRKLIEVLHMDTVVVDVFVTRQGDESFTTTLIELNPFMRLTDPCPYSWKNGGDFDGGIRYRTMRYDPYHNTTHAGQDNEPWELSRDVDQRRT